MAVSLEKRKKCRVIVARGEKEGVRLCLETKPSGEREAR